MQLLVVVPQLPDELIFLSVLLLEGFYLAGLVGSFLLLYTLLGPHSYFQSFIKLKQLILALI